MDWTKREASSPHTKSEQIGDSEEAIREENEEEEEEIEGEDDDDDDDAESCIIGNSEVDEIQGCTSWRMWCLLGQEGAWGDEKRRERNTDEEFCRRSTATAINDAEKNRLFWEACLADESSITPIIF